MKLTQEQAVYYKKLGSLLEKHESLSFDYRKVSADYESIPFDQAFYSALTNNPNQKIRQNLYKIFLSMPIYIMACKTSSLYSSISLSYEKVFNNSIEPTFTLCISDKITFKPSSQLSDSYLDSQFEKLESKIKSIKPSVTHSLSLYNLSNIPLTVSESERIACFERSILFPIYSILSPIIPGFSYGYPKLNYIAPNILYPAALSASQASRSGCFPHASFVLNAPVDGFTGWGLNKTRALCCILIVKGDVLESLALLIDKCADCEYLFNEIVILDSDSDSSSVGDDTPSSIIKPIIRELFSVCLTHAVDTVVVSDCDTMMVFKFNLTGGDYRAGPDVIKFEYRLIRADTPVYTMRSVLSSLVYSEYEYVKIDFKERDRQINKLGKSFVFSKDAVHARQRLADATLAEYNASGKISCFVKIKDEKKSVIVNKTSKMMKVYRNDLRTDKTNPCRVFSMSATMYALTFGLSPTESKKINRERSEVVIKLLDFWELRNHYFSKPRTQSYEDYEKQKLKSLNTEIKAYREMTLHNETLRPNEIVDKYLHVPKLYHYGWCNIRYNGGHFGGFFFSMKKLKTESKPTSMSQLRRAEREIEILADLEIKHYNYKLDNICYDGNHIWFYGFGKCHRNSPSGSYFELDRFLAEVGKDVLRDEKRNVKPEYLINNDNGIVSYKTRSTFCSLM